MSPKFCVFSKTSYEKKEIVLDRKILSDLLSDMFERMFWVILVSRQICVWHNFGGLVSKDVFTNSSRRYISQVARTIPGAWFQHFVDMCPKRFVEENAQDLSARKKFMIICGGYPSKKVWGTVKWLFQKTIARDILFFCPKSVWRNVCVWYFQHL